VAENINPIFCDGAYASSGNEWKPLTTTWNTIQTMGGGTRSRLAVPNGEMQFSV